VKALACVGLVAVAGAILPCFSLGGSRNLQALEPSDSLSAPIDIGAANNPTSKGRDVLGPVAPGEYSFGSATGESDYLLYVPLPPDVEANQVMRLSEPLRARLDRIVREHLAAQNGRLREEEDRIVVFVDHEGRLLLPDLDAARSRVSNGQGQSSLATTPDSDLTFSFDSPTYPWTAEELATLTAFFDESYPMVKAVYGPPAFSITVNARKDPVLPYAGIYSPSTNEMVLPNASLEPALHEMIHAFRDDDIIGLASYEEGMTRTAEVEVFNRLDAYEHWDENHRYTYDVYYEGLNRDAIGAQNGNFFAGYASVLLRYQLAGYAWAKVLLENPNFLKDFNATLFVDTLSDPTTRYTESKLLGIARTVQSAVEDVPFPTWYTQQHVLNTNPPRGFLVYQRINQFTVDYFYRDTGGSEASQANAEVQWAVYDYQNVLLDSGSDLTSPLGWISFYPALPSDYTGRIKVVASTSDGSISDTGYRFAPNDHTQSDPYRKAEVGVFGIVRQADAGTITITPLDGSTPPASATVANGAFSVPSLETVEGRFLVTFTDTGGHDFSTSFTKDASMYFLLLDLDLDGDGVLDESDNCPAWPNPEQSLPPWSIPPNDPDCDGFSDAEEAFEGTNGQALCPATAEPDDEVPDAWPPDFNDDTSVNLADVFLFRPHFATIDGNQNYNRRFDLSSDGRINLADVFILRQHFATQCGA
jgi:hypothetical protein